MGVEGWAPACGSLAAVCVAGSQPAAEEGKRSSDTSVEQGERVKRPGAATHLLPLVQQHGGAHCPAGEQTTAVSSNRSPFQSFRRDSGKGPEATEPEGPESLPPGFNEFKTS